MQFVIQVVEANEKKNQKNSRGGLFNTVEVVYKKDGKVEAKSFPDWANKEIYQSLLTLAKGDVRTVTTEKDSNGYWKWLSLTEGSQQVGPETADNPSASSSGSIGASAGRSGYSGSKSSGSTYETSEERARRQVMIVRQSSASTAVALVDTGSITLNGDDKAGALIEVAKRIEAYVLGE